VAPSDIASVEAHVVPAHLTMIDHGVSIGDRASFLTSLPYQMATAVLEPSATVGQSPASVSAPVRALMDRIAVATAADFAAGYPKLWPARVRVTTASGQVHERMVEHVPGDPARPFDASAVADKFHRYVAPVAGEAAELERLARGALADPGALLAAIDGLCERVAG
jgi:2-methylcitrate dehydratase PrpD